MLNLNELKKFNNNGYIAYYIPEHHLSGNSGIVYEHMIMAEELLGRELRDGETVHHEDRNKHNNSLDNLMVFKTNADHVAYHMGCEIFKEDDVYVAVKRGHKSSGSLKGSVNECPICGKEKNAWANLCMNCANKERAKHIPPKEELIAMLLEHNMLSIGKAYGVSDNAVRKWCKKYELPYLKKDIEKFRKNHAIMTIVS